MRPNGTTTVLGIIGNPIEHTLSPVIHNSAFEACGENAVYVPFLVHNLEHALLGVRALGLRGVSVTIPFKVDVIPFLDDLTDVGRAVGSVNTIVNDGGKLVGTNTDGAGAMRALEESTTVNGKHLAVLGNGGSAFGIVTTLLLERDVASVTVVGRSDARVRAFLAKVQSATKSTRVHAEVFNADHSNTAIAEADIIINTTPIGMTPNTEASPLPAHAIRNGQTVFDIVYTPKETTLLRAAKGSGANVVYGYKMLLYQAVGQFEAWTKKDAPVAVMERALLAALKERS